MPVADAVAITARMPFTTMAGTESAAGDALHRFPPRLQRLWIWSDPISPAASTRPGKAAASSASSVRRTVGVAAPIVQPESFSSATTRRSIRLRSTRLSGSGRPARSCGIRSVAPAKTRAPPDASSPTASSTDVGETYFTCSPKP